MILRSKARSSPLTKPLTMALLVLCLSAIDQLPLLAQSTPIVDHKFLAQNNNNDPNQGSTDEDLLRQKRQRERRRMMQNAAVTDNSSGANSSATTSSSEDPDMPGFRMRKKSTGAPREYNSFGGPGPGPGPAGNGRRNFNQEPGSEDTAPPGMRGGPDGDQMQIRRRLGDGSNPGTRPGGARAAAPKPGGAGGPFGGRPLDLTPLSLSADQKQKIQEMRLQTKMKVKDLRKSVIEKEANLRDMMFNPDATEPQIRTARKELRRLLDLVDEANMNVLLGIRTMLSADQKKRLPECMPGRNNTANGVGPPLEGPPGFPGGPAGVSAQMPPAPPPGFSSAFDAGGFGNSDSSNLKRRRAASRRSFQAESNNTSK